MVTKDVEPYAIVGGMLARLIQKRFAAEVIAALQELCWWDWPSEGIQRNIPAIKDGRLELIK